MMVQSTIDKIKDTTIYRSIRKLCGVIDEQNTVVENLQNELDNFDLDGVKSDVTNLKTNDAAQDTKITALTDNVSNLDEEMETATDEISYLKQTVSSDGARLTNAETDILNLRDADKRLTNDLPKTYTLYRNGEGKIQAQVETIGGTLFNSNILDMVIPYQYDIISGTTERSFKLDITMSDGSKYTTNDFIIPEGGGTEIVVTGITLAKDTSNVNRFHVGINLSDGSMIDSGYITMVDNVVATFVDSKLTISVNGVSSVPVAIDVSGEFTAGTGIVIESGTISIDDTVVALKSDIADMETKTNASATYATKTALASTDANVALAQSTADDANNKANSAIDNVSISGSTISFTKINDEHIDVTLPTISEISINNGQPITISFTSYTSGSWAYFNITVGYLSTILAPLGKMQVLVPMYGYTASVAYGGSFTNSNRNTIASLLLGNSNLSDGKYIMNYIISPNYLGENAFYNSSVNSIVGRMMVVISDKEIIQTSPCLSSLGNYDAFAPRGVSDSDSVSGYLYITDLYRYG